MTVKTGSISTKYFHLRVRLGSCKIELSPPVIQVILLHRSKAILMFCFYLFYVLESNFVLYERYVRFHSFSCSGN